jgi:hypothetical protein
MKRAKQRIPPSLVLKMGKKRKCSSAYLPITDEMRMWLDMKPVGREFGSDEFEKYEYAQDRPS